MLLPTHLRDSAPTLCLNKSSRPAYDITLLSLVKVNQAINSLVVFCGEKKTAEHGYEKEGPRK